MKNYAYINPNNYIEQIAVNSSNAYRSIVFDEVFIRPYLEHYNTYRNNELLQLMDIVCPNDCVFTSSLTNFSLDFVSALSVVADLSSKGAHVIAFAESFDSESPEGRRLLEMLPLMQCFRRNANVARSKRRQAGIDRAAAEGKYQGRQAYSVQDFPRFRDLYQLYMSREISKVDFARELGVSRPTLDRLLKEFLRRKEE